MKTGQERGEPRTNNFLKDHVKIVKQTNGCMLLEPSIAVICGHHGWEDEGFLGAGEGLALGDSYMEVLDL